MDYRFVPSCKPLAIDLFCGLGGWTGALLSEGYRVVGFDNERHQYAIPEPSSEGNGGKGTKPIEKRGWTQGCAVTLGIEGSGARARTHLTEYPAQLVLQDVRTLHGAQFKHAALIVASPPCQAYSYMAMPWTRAKQLAAWYRDPEGQPDRIAQLTELFDACFRIQREAGEAGRQLHPHDRRERQGRAAVGRAGEVALWSSISLGRRSTYDASGISSQRYELR